jgi:hypothetical protein
MNVMRLNSYASRTYHYWHVFVPVDQPSFMHRGFRQHVSKVSSFDLLSSS